MRKTAKRVLIALGVLFGLLWGFWLVAVPSGVIQKRITQELGKNGIHAKFSGFGKGLLYSLKCDSVVIAPMGAHEDGGSLILQDVRVSMSLPSLVMLSPAVDMQAVLAEGQLSGRASTGWGEKRLSLRATGVDLAQLGIDGFVVGLRAGGLADLEAEVLNGSGEARLSATGLSFSPYKYMGFVLPLDLFKQARALLVIKAGAMELKSATLEGDGIFSRLSGSVGSGRVRLKLELMPSAGVEESQPYFKMLEQYRKTKGYYEIPINTFY